MSDATDLWTLVKTEYATAGLLTLTNVRDPGASAIDDTVGEAAAQAVIDLWPRYAQEAYDSTDGAHKQVAKEGVIAILYRRGGTSTQIARVKYEDVFSPDGMIAEVRKTGPRSHQVVSTNSGLQHRREDHNGRKKRPWADNVSMPTGWLPRGNSVED